MVDTNSLEFCKINQTCGIDVQVLKDTVRRQLLELCFVFTILTRSYFQFLPKTCDELIYDVSYLGVPIEDCNTIFNVQNTEMGRCFTANGLDF